MNNVIIREGDVCFAKPLPRALLRDGRLSFAARGLFCFLWDLPGTWSAKVEHVARMGPEKRDAIRSRIRELEMVGGMRIEPLQGTDGKLFGSRWVLVAPERWACETPLSGLPRGRNTEVRVSRNSVEPTLGEMPGKGLREEGSSTKAEHTTKNTVDNLRGLGLLLQNNEDYANVEKLLQRLGGRLDLVRNAIAIVRARKSKNRPFISSVSVEALKLLAEERYRNQIAGSLAATARKMSSL